MKRQKFLAMKTAMPSTHRVLCSIVVGQKTLPTLRFAGSILYLSAGLHMFSLGFQQSSNIAILLKPLKPRETQSGPTNISINLHSTQVA